MHSIAKQIETAMIADRFRLRRRLRSLEEHAKQGRNVQPQLDQLARQVADSAERARQRASARPPIAYDDTLPIVGQRAKIAATIAEHQVVVVCGETGSGKSTQLPKICLELGRGVHGMIGHTQPRRIAARAVATRIAEEVGVSLGTQVGFKVRFADATNPDTLVKLMTDGILLAETQGDRFLEQYDTIILDEAHERSLNIDFLIGYLKRLLPKRPDLKLIITSATIDVERFARHFGTDDKPAPIISVGGRVYPVELRYRPLPAEDDEDAGDTDWLSALCDAVDELARIDRGDMLLFLPTERDIHEAAKTLRGRTLPGDSPNKPSEILPLYARLPNSEQQRIFHPGGRRRIVLATNVAESSLTVPGIRYVVDLGTARISRYSARSKTQRLPIEPISQASADQRAGRCGRIGPGICIRLYGEDDYLGRDRFTSPEIQRSNLAAVILQAKMLGLGDVGRFPFLEPPKPAAVRDGFKTLFELGAIDDRKELTPLGRRLGRLPVDPRIGRMILAGADEGCLADVLIIASVLELRDPRDRPVDRQEDADAAHAKFADPKSDFITYLNLWDFHADLRHKLSHSQLRKACRQNFLSANRMREWVDIHRQLLRLVQDSGLHAGRRRNDYEPIHRAILTGLLTNIANRSGKFDYAGTGGGTLHLWPGSGLFKTKPKWVVGAELVETTKRYLRCCAQIDPAWIEPLAEHLVRRTYSEPHWDAKSGSAMAYERVTLSGLIIVPRRHVALGPVDPHTARELLIREGLVEGGLATRAPFLRHNRELVEELHRTQEKLRRHDLLHGPWAQVDFYEERIPEDVFDRPRLDQWRKEAERGNPKLLFMTPEDLLTDPDASVDPSAFPDQLATDGGELPLDYRFEPGTEEDGLSVTAPIETLGQLDAGQLEWLVPGLLEQKITALIKSLPKSLRRKLVPAPDTARQVARQIDFGAGDLLVVLAQHLSRIAGERITPADFQREQVPRELQMAVRVVNEAGETIAAGRELPALRRELGQMVADRIATVEHAEFNRDGLTEWDFDELPSSIEVPRGGLRMRCYPKLVDEGATAALRLADSAEEAERDSQRGAVRLFALAARRDIRSQTAWFPKLEAMTLHAATLPGFELKRELADLVAWRAFPAEPAPRTRAEFEARVTEGRKRLGLAVQDATALLPPLLAAYHEARLAVDGIAATTPGWQEVRTDIDRQIGKLTSPGFLTSTPSSWLGQYRRFFQAICVRIDRLRSGGSMEQDAALCRELAAHWDAYENRLKEHAESRVTDPELEHLRWMLEEYRVSLFAQTVGASLRISPQRIAKQWEKVR